MKCKLNSIKVTVAKSVAKAEFMYRNMTVLKTVKLNMCMNTAELNGVLRSNTHLAF